MKKILVVIRYFERALFFYRIKKALDIKGYEFIFIVDHISAYLYLKYHKCTVYLVKKRTIDIKVNKEIKNTVEYRTGKLKYNQLEDIYISTYFFVNKIYKKESLDYIFIWNGTSIFDLPIIDFAKKYNIKTLFFEIANLPGKIFVDRKGTNARSDLYYNKSILKNYNVNEENFIIWKKEYLNKKLYKHTVLQAQKRKYATAISFIDIIYSVCVSKIEYDSSFLLERLLAKFHYKKINIFYDNIDYKKMNYIFFPLQVSNDSQILIHSDISLMDAILYAIKEAKEKNLELIIKPHPAEHNQEIFNEICKLKEKYKFYFINDNTFKLIKYAKKVITINSTVGLEAKICGKEVEILGRAFYKNFTEEDLRRYILGYLVNIDYFSEKEISKEAIKELEKRIY